MEEDEAAQKPSVTLSQSSVMIINYWNYVHWKIEYSLQSQMDISHDVDIKGSSPEGTKSNEDSGVETMEVDDKVDSEVVVERKEAEKRKRTSSR